MGLLRTLLRSHESSGLATPEQWLVDWFRGGSRSTAGVDVTEETALDYSAFFAGVRVLAEDVSSLPLHVYERLAPRGKRRATDHPLYELLHERPNELMTSQELRETLQGHAITWGNGLAYVVRDGGGRVRELWPLRPDRMRLDVRRLGRGRRRVWYLYDDDVHSIQARLEPDEVLHVKAISGDGLWGWSMVRRHRNAIGLGVATETYGAALFRNGAVPGAVLKHPGQLSETARGRLKADFESWHKGLDKAQRIAVLEEGLEWDKVGIPPEDAQFLSTREFQVQELARILRVSPYKLGDLSHATFSNIEHAAIDHVVSSLRPWLVRWEQAFALRLFTARERPRFFAEHLVDGLLRGDIKARYDAYAVGRQWGWLNGDDIAELENRNPLPDGRGSVYLVPLNMVPAPTPGELDAQEPPRAGRRSADLRRKLAERFVPLMVDVESRIARMEQAEVESLVRRHLEPRGVVDFLAALEGLYETVRERAEGRWRPLAATLALAVARDAAGDVGVDEPEGLEERIGRFAASYVRVHVAYRVGSALGQLTQLAGGDDPAETIRARLEAWVADRPGQVALQESVQLPEAVAREVWRAAGVRRLRWRAAGSENCDFCTELDGRVVGIDQPFLAEGTEAPGGDGSLIASTNVFHPPAHRGCVCQIEPET